MITESKDIWAEEDAFFELRGLFLAWGRNDVHQKNTSRHDEGTRKGGVDWMAGPVPNIWKR